MGSDPANSAAKRKIESTVKHQEPAKKKRKKSELKKVQPPSAEEINRLRETENVFHSNLFRLQIEELLKEVNIKEITRGKLNTWVEKIMEFLLNVDLSFSVKTSNNEPINIPNVLVPTKSKSKSVDLSFTFLKPKSVNIVGSFNCDCVMKYSANIDILVEMPKESFHKDDYLNEKYLRKRNIYLSCLASELIKAARNNSIKPEMNYVITNSFDKPLLQLKHTDEKLQKYSILVHIVPEKGIFKETRFLPNMNNVRYGWYFDAAGDGKLNFSTPFYNSIICQDLVSTKNEELRATVFSENVNFKNAYVLLKVWLHQRQLDEGLGSFSGFLLAMFIVYLYKKKKLNHLMSSYQVIRTVWVLFEQTNWHSDGISLSELEKESMTSSLEMFRSNYEVTFIDVTGSTNLASALSLSSYLYLKMQSRYAVQYLDDCKMNNFSALFMSPVQLTKEFDHVIYFNKSSCVRKVVKQNTDLQLQLDLRSDTHSQFLRIVSKLLKRALGQRVSCFFSRIEPLNLTWSVDEKMPAHGNIVVGLILDPIHAFNVIDKGPTANLPEAAEFRQFWNTKAELRRFRDGDVCETVCWAETNDTLQKKRLIVREAVRFVLDNKLKIKPQQYLYIADQMDTVVFDVFNQIFASRGTGEETSIDIIASFLDLSKTLRQLQDLPLEITSTQGTSAVFRYSELFPVLPNVHCNTKKSVTTNDNATIFKNDILLKHMPLYVPPIEAVIQFSSSNKWPDDLDAIRRLQAAFCIKLSSALSDKCKYVCQPYTSYVDILKDGYVFRIRIANNSEITAIKRSIDESGEVSYCDNAESVQLEKSLVQLPTLNSTIHGLHQEHPAFGPACGLTKRWLRSQLIDDYYLPDVCVDLILSYLCLNPQPYSSSHQPQTLFFRLLKFISSTNWFSDPIIINFNSELSRQEILDLDSALNENRASLPPLILVTPFDKSGSLWTREQPSLMILKRLSSLAQASLQVIDSSLLENESCDAIRQIFRPPLQSYDILIWTVPTANTSCWLAVDAEPSKLVAIKRTPEFDKLPIVDFHPMRSYVQELRKHYDDKCLFFYDFYGGNFIGIVLKPEAKSQKEFKISNLKCSKEKKNKLEFDIEAMIDDFRILGNGLVSSIERK